MSYVGICYTYVGSMPRQAAEQCSRFVFAAEPSLRAGMLVRYSIPTIRALTAFSRPANTFGGL